MSLSAMSASSYHLCLSRGRPPVGAGSFGFAQRRPCPGGALVSSVAPKLSLFAALSLCLLVSVPVFAETPPPPPRIFHATDQPAKPRERSVKRKQATRKAKSKRARRKKSRQRKAQASIPAGAPMWRHLRRLGAGRYAMSPKARRFYIQELSYVKLKVLVDLYYRKGRALGYSLLYVSPKSPLRRLGLREKDVLMSVNGRPLRSTYQAMLAYWSLQKEKQYQVRILRDNKPQTLTILVQ